MAHLIDMSNGRANMAYVGETPWHGLGATMQPGQTLEEWRKAAGLDWEAVKAPVLYKPQPVMGSHGSPIFPEPRVAKGQNVLYRTDTNEALSVVSDRYQIVQPRDVIEFYRDLTERHGFKLETAGSLKGGRRIWALARTGDVIRVSGNDIVNGYLLLSTSFDGSRGTEGRYTAIRVVCNNTISAADGEGRAHFSVGHNTKFDADAAKIKLGVGDSFRKFQDGAQAMAEKGVTPQQQVAFLLDVYHGLTVDDVKAREGNAKTLVDKTMERLAGILANAPGADMKSAKGTVWGLVNAVTRDVDHSRPARTQENRLDSAWYGPGEAMKNKAWELGLKLAA